MRSQTRRGEKGRERERDERWTRRILKKIPVTGEKR